MKKTNLHLFKSLVAFLCVLFFFNSCKRKQHGKNIAKHHQYETPKRGASYLNFPTPLSPETPWDVDRKLQQQLLNQGKFAQVQRLFEILSWQWFISLNWPVDKKGKPRNKISEQGNPEWFDWKESYEVFLPNGQKPDAWGKFNFPPGFKIADEYKGEKILFRGNKFTEFNRPDIEDEVKQAFTSPIMDQNGNITRYEVRMNRKEFEYILHNELYNFDGQIAFSKEKGNVTFPEGNRKDEGVIEIKVAWKILEDSDIKSRYFTTKGYVINPNGSYTLKDVGMVGMHISSKTKSSPQWIWTTFEHVDNLEVNLLDEIDGKPLRPSYNNPDCEICPINVYDKNKKTQIQRIIPISGATKELNASVQKLLKKEDSKLQYYQQIGAQWPTNPSAKPYTLTDTTSYKLPQAVTNKSGGNPTPVYLTNMVMETFFQGGTITSGNSLAVNQQFINTKTNKVAYEKLYSGVAGDSTEAYNTFIANEPAFFQMNNFPFDIDTKNTQKTIFGTESCVACHFSSAIAKGFKFNSKGEKVAVFGLPTSADFSWLLNQKAHFKSTK